MCHLLRLQQDQLVRGNLGADVGADGDVQRDEGLEGLLLPRYELSPGGTYFTLAPPSAPSRPAPSPTAKPGAPERRRAFASSAELGGEDEANVVVLGRRLAQAGCGVRRRLGRRSRGGRPARP